MDWSVTLVMATMMAVWGPEQVKACSESATLGMASGAIKNSSLSGSSSLPGHEAVFGRVSDKYDHWSWCPENPIETDSYEWLQVDFEEIVTISHIIIGGEFGDGEGTRFARKFRVEYQRGENDAWIQWVLNGTQVFQGPSSARTQRIVQTHKKLLATRVRIVPVKGGDNDREEVCVRVEFYGCHRQGVAAYSIPQGDSKSDRYSFLDREYDGKTSSSNILSDGLGLLTDGTKAGDDFTQDPFLWVGWKSDLHVTVEMKFEMDHLRNLSSVTIHSNNQHNEGVRVFRKATIYVSTSSPILLPDTPVKVFEYGRDDMRPSRQVNITLDNVLARFVNIVLEFDASWIMISQVNFTSQLVIGQYPPQVSGTTAAEVTSEVTTTRPVVKTTRSRQQTTRPPVPEAESTTPDTVIIPGNNQLTTVQPGENNSGIDKSIIGIIVGSCLGVILVVVIVICVCCFYQRKKMSSSTSNDSSTGEGSTTSMPPVLKNQNGNTSEYDLPWGSRPLPHPPPNGTPMQSSGYASDGYGGAPYASIPVDQYNNCHQLTPIPQSCLHHYMTSGGLLTLPGVHHERHQCSRAASTLPASPHNNLLIPLSNKDALPYDANQYDLVQRDTSPYDSSNYRSSPTVPLPNIQSGTGSSVYGVPANSQLDQDIPQIPYASLRFIEKLGSGQCGEVHLCQMTALTEGSDKKRLVAMKKLQTSATETTKSDFMREIKIMSKLRHPNIIQVLGVCSDTASSPCVVTEYMAMGDLNQFLQKHVPEGTTLLNKQPLTQSTLLHITAQIARGMSYLEQLNVTHRDLAARNCLVGDNYQVKISDFGMSRNLYSQHYYKVEGRVVLPIRWMAWESVLLGKFTTKSDVWSFGVTLWEIFSFAREQPFSRYSDDDVIANCMNYYHNNMGQVIYLNQPSQCTKEMYDLMRACWNHNDFHRPTFKDISLFLSMKSPHADSNEERRMSPTRLTAC